MVEIFGFLELEQKLPFFKGLRLPGLGPLRWDKNNIIFKSLLECNPNGLIVKIKNSGYRVCFSSCSRVGQSAPNLRSPLPAKAP